MPEERALLMRSLWLLIQARLTLARTKFEPAPVLPEPATLQDSRQIQAQRLRARHVARLVAYAAAVAPVNVASLHRSLVLWQLLARERIPCSLRIAESADSTQVFTSRAWVECHGEPLREAADLYEQFGVPSRAVVPAGAMRQPDA